MPFFYCAYQQIAYVKFRNASQDERLSIITRMNLLELIELRARSWQTADGQNTYYKHKVSDMQVGNEYQSLSKVWSEIIGIHDSRMNLILIGSHCFII